ncbi:hypothetical protein AVEN_175876-1 [Araneus ventricosus]|uniref:Uncharacterized protein n=1 Tax=Araneus ventricosus TaxID=182803 RepID=A0A4Y2ECS2_ARAVE|nr:hypothetical protein AVEN_175876-1 [Araneus ventricosus]
MSECTRRKVGQKKNSCIDRFHKPTFSLKKVNTRSWRKLQFYQSCLRANSSSQTGEMKSAIVEVMIRGMRSRPPRIPTSNHLSACSAAR